MFNWKRFWCPTDGKIQLGEDGYLFDPESDYGLQLNPDLVSLDNSDSPCLVLLGEPGIGKSTAIKQLIASSETNYGPEFVWHIDLGDYGQESRLIDDLFRSARFREWQSGQAKLYLFLDSLDECRLQIPQVAKIVSREFGRCIESLPRLRLRIACRTADWPHALSKIFSGLWESDRALEYELAPLRRTDVRLAAEQSGVDDQRFLDEVARTSTQPLAIKPITLRLLLRAFKQDQGFPKKQVDLYSDGCRLLCDESNQDRRDSRHLGRLSVDERLDLASAIATAMILCNKSAMYFGPEDGSLSVDDLTTDNIRTLIGGCYPSSVTPVEAVRETIGTGLFSGHGQHRAGFAHRTYAEFLAARFLHRSTLSRESQCAILCHPDERMQKVVPQLAQTAGWLSSIDNSVFSAIAAVDPQVLLRSDVSSVDSKQRQSLLTSLFRLAENNELLTRDWGERLHYQKLSHPEIASQIRPYIVDRSKPTPARRLAIQVAQRCNVRELQGELANLVLDSTDEQALRHYAVHAVMDVGDLQTKLKLKPLAITASSASDLTIKNAIWQELWPAQISTAELVEGLRFPPNQRVKELGYFVTHELAAKLRKSDLADFLPWICGLSEQLLQEFTVRRFVAQVLQFALRNIDDPIVFDPLVRFFLDSLRCRRTSLPWEGCEQEIETVQRRALAAEVVAQIDDFSAQGPGLLFQPPHLLRPEDALWMVSKVVAEKNVQVAEYWSQIIDRVLDPSISGLVDAVLEASEKCESLRTVTASRFAAVDIYSDEAKKLRESHAEFKQFERERAAFQNHRAPSPPSTERLEDFLAKAESGNAEAWFDAAWQLQFGEDGDREVYEHSLDIAEMPGWKAATESTQRRLIDGAVQFLELYNPDCGSWVGTNSTPTGATWGYMAFVLLLRTAPARYESLAESTWFTWAPV